MTEDDIHEILQDRIRQHKQDEVLKQLRVELEAATQKYVGEAFDRDKIKADVRRFLEDHRLELPSPCYEILIGIDPEFGSAKVFVQFCFDFPPFTSECK